MEVASRAARTMAACHMRHSTSHALHTQMNTCCSLHYLTPRAARTMAARCRRNRGMQSASGENDYPLPFALRSACLSLFSAQPHHGCKTTPHPPHPPHSHTCRSILQTPGEPLAPQTLHPRPYPSPSRLRATPAVSFRGGAERWQQRPPVRLKDSTRPLQGPRPLRPRPLYRCPLLHPILRRGSA